jgi:hypothetical protein
VTDEKSVYKAATLMITLHGAGARRQADVELQDASAAGDGTLVRVWVWIRRAISDIEEKSQGAAN